MVATDDPTTTTPATNTQTSSAVSYRQNSERLLSASKQTMGKGLGRIRSFISKKKSSANNDALSPGADASFTNVNVTPTPTTFNQFNKDAVYFDPTLLMPKLPDPIPVGEDKTATPQSSVDPEEKDDTSALIVIHNVANTPQYVPVHPVPSPPPAATPPRPTHVTPQATPQTHTPGSRASISVATSKQSKPPSVKIIPSPKVAPKPLAVKIIASPKPAPAAAVPPSPAETLESEPCLSIEQVHVPTATDEVSEYSGGSAPSLSDVEVTTTEEDEEDSSAVDKRVNAVLDAAEEYNRRKLAKDRSGSPSSRKEVEEESCADFSYERESPKSRRCRSRRDEASLEESTLEGNTSGSLTADSASSYSEHKRKSRSRRSREYDAESPRGYESSDSDSSFRASPAADAVKRTNEKSMHKDIMSHGPGGSGSMMVRAMYYVPLPREEGDVVVEVEASTVSFRDCLLRRNLGMYKAPFPYIPGCESVGHITSLGKEAKSQGFRVGDRVMAIHPHGGGNSKYARYNYKSLTPLLSDIDAADAVCLGEVYMTAYQALRMGRKDGTPLTGSNVMVTDGYSPVGQAAIQLARCEGAHVFVTITDTNQESYIQSLGAKCLPFSPSKWLPKCKGMMDIVIDNTCFDSYDSSWKALNKRGVLICTGTSSLYNLRDYGLGNECGCGAFGDMRDIEAKWMRTKAKYMMSQTKFYDFYESLEKEHQMYEQELKYLCFLVEEGRIKPKIAEQVTIEEVPDAQKYLETGKANGSIVCLP